ncbi:hypothetical protein [Flavobacterium sp. WV_118_3]|uniref:hypothetical protein n=1 Tax=Flavobacterium sp. WV_118_3 TaxID=3151764 RepID=UPI00321A2B5C
MLENVLKIIDNIYFKMIYFLCLGYTVMYIQFWFNNLNDPPFEQLSAIVIKFTVAATVFAMIIASAVLIKEKIINQQKRKGGR